MSQVYSYELDDTLSGYHATFVADSAAIRAEEKEDNIAKLEQDYQGACTALGVQNLQTSNSSSNGKYAVLRLGNNQHLEAELVIYSPDTRTDELKVEVTDASYSKNGARTPERVAFDTIENYLETAEKKL